MSLPTLDEQVELIESATRILSRMPNLVERSAHHVLIVGDVHGSPTTLKHLEWLLEEHNFELVVFLGDYVDRGSAQIEAVDFVLRLLIECPHRVILLRGNHELPYLNYRYHFFRAVLGAYPEHVWHLFNQCFAQLPYCLVLNGEGILMHGGISKDIVHIRALNTHPKGMLEPPDEVQQLLWNDPYDFEGTFAPNVFRAGFWLFSRTALEEFLEANSLCWLIRAHEPVAGGYEPRWDGLLTTVFSCPEGSPDGRAAVLVLEDEKRTVVHIG
ncbi:metallophosphoesterase [Methermicoccus shengliensis]|uniref:Serine/threonine protein phosphatase n=1 Tax=Methermicoccus shengliensis TaxID=660064 RepID=A0A832VXS0_9EURY|nr:metallophosphoesterase [Methermicoccus shengliensis]KUK04592.1 MAG: Bis(5'nucleosyl)-tetraphosphatase, ApaH [Euryarchaeota archaeon 55_53]KUK29980.1 MAG: Bis(5'nucleosyl)-tetraphosphatase [Methanosarcinales archeaon 56_1174]MDI3488462.1 hypothetical protein [Methanosarcinales archaeon]MDN5294920.1 hypothetical protein [Methanosarcinales archaeon]HIH70112.1 serine/threonine protein phosphatase [Methermicoccus shengliensis]